jgi:hypothetical protein
MFEINFMLAQKLVEHLLHTMRVHWYTSHTSTRMNIVSRGLQYVQATN